MRISLDAELFTDPRFIGIKGELGEAEALWRLVELWRLGQYYWGKKPNACNIPKTLFEMLPHHDLCLKYHFALVKEDGVYCCGAKERWQFLRKSNQSDAGKASAEARLLNLGTAIPVNASNNPRTVCRTKPNSSERAPNETEPSLSLSLSSSTSTSRKRNKSRTHSQARDASEHWLIKIWNENRGQLPEAKGLSEKRLKACTQRESEEPNQEIWVDVVRRLSQSDFCSGKNERGWVANFDFLLKPDTRIKVLEGQYGQRVATPQPVRLSAIDEKLVRFRAIYPDLTEEQLKEEMKWSR